MVVPIHRYDFIAPQNAAQVSPLNRHTKKVTCSRFFQWRLSPNLSEHIRSPEPLWFQSWGKNASPCCPHLGMAFQYSFQFSMDRIDSRYPHINDRTILNEGLSGQRLVPLNRFLLPTFGGHVLGHRDKYLSTLQDKRFWKTMPM